MSIKLSIHLARKSWRNNQSSEALLRSRFPSWLLSEAKCTCSADAPPPTGIIRLLASSGALILLMGIGSAPQMEAASSESLSTEKQHPVCGQWCASPSNTNMKCNMDPEIIPCQREWCNTTCKLWDLFVLGPDDKRRPVSCNMYAAGSAYPRGAEICDKNCLIPEIRTDRYPAPTGYGIMCRPNTCAPAATPLVNVGVALGTLRCPCNWFGSECTNDWTPVQKVIKGKRWGALEFITLLLDKKDWKRVLEHYRPGGVIRIVHLDPNGTPQEMACALAGFETEGELTFLTSPPDPSLRPEPRQVAERLRAMKTTSIVSNLYVNPSISGFFNGNYTYLLEFLRDNDNITRLVILSSGAGLGGALSAIDAVIRENRKRRNPIEIHLYYGLRNLVHLPFRDRLEQLALSGVIQLTLVVTDCPDWDEQQLKNVPSTIRASVERGEAAGKLTPTVEMEQFLSNVSRPYTQHVVGLDLSSSGGLLKNVSFKDTVFITCGRVEILRDTPAILKALSGSDRLVSEHFFTNI